MRRLVTNNPAYYYTWMIKIDGSLHLTEGTEEGIPVDCHKWNNNVIDVLVSKKPDLVFTIANIGNQPNVPKGYVDQWKKLNEEDIIVFAIRDNPWFNFDVPSCVEEKGEESIECTAERKRFFLWEICGMNKKAHPKMSIILI